MNYKDNKLLGENEPDSTRQGVWVKIAEGVLDIHRGNFYPNNTGWLKNGSFAANCYPELRLYYTS